MRMNSLQRAYRLPWLLAAAALFIVAAALLPFDDTIASAVRAFSHRVGPRHMIQEFLVLIRPFGKGDVIILLALVMGLVGCRRRALQLLLALTLVTLLVWPFKLGVGRERPGRPTSDSFPSGDVATIAALCAPLAQASPLAGAVAALGTVGVAAGRIYDGRHYPADTVAGAAFGLLAGAVAIRLVNRIRRLPRRRWFAAGAVLLVIVDSLQLTWARSLPNILAFLFVWGPVAALLLASRVAASLTRRQARWSDTAARAAWIRLLMMIVLMTLAHYVLLTASSTLWDRDEPRFSRATVEMVQTGNYLYPTFNGALRPDKPILIYWLMSIPVRLFGAGEMTCRAVAPLAAAGAALMTAWIGLRLAGPLTGLLAGAIMVSTPLLLVSGTAATTDALLLFCITGAIAAFLKSWWDGLRATHIACLAACLAAALLTKGPVGLVVPLLAVGGIMAATHRQAAVRVRAYLPWLLLAVLVGVAAFLAWGLPANAATGGELARRGLGHHVVNRAVTPLESHGGASVLFVLYYLPLIALTFFPWTLYLLPALGSPATPAPAARPGRRLTLAWALPIIVLMSLVATKLPHYILPAWPALALLTALGLTKSLSAPRHPITGLERTGRWSFGLVGALLSGGLIILPWFVPVYGVRVPAVSAGLVLAGMTWLTLAHHRQARHAAAVVTLLAGMSLLILTAALRLLPAIEAVKLAPALASVIHARTAETVPVSTCGFGEPSLTFYLNRGPVEALDEAALADWAQRPGRGVLVVTEPKAARHWEALRRGAVRVLETHRGFNYSQGKWLDTFIMVRGEPSK
jgi:4-amino-4-deoxy-L-arabinose transferase-like glycosyltransferase/membrane-associated phospholipid phosphatase